MGIKHDWIVQEEKVGIKGGGDGVSVDNTF